MAARSERKAQPPRSSSVAARVSRRDAQDDRFQRREHAQSRGLAERNQADRGGDQVGGEGLQIGRGRCVFVDAVPAGERADRDRVGDAFRQAPAAAMPRPRRRKPCPDRASRRAARATARCAAASSFSAAWSLSFAVGVAQQDRVVAAGAVDQDIGEPGAQRVAVGDVAAFHRPFQAMRIGVGAGRERRRQPGEQTQQRVEHRKLTDGSPSPCGRGLEAVRARPLPHPLAR